ncbi:MAG: nucleotidyltransferase family protein [Candidatus Dadabacteria bacterium]|nr:nucleotidyltransferase family protein [Candidatus Dadabacteria bacterium]
MQTLEEIKTIINRHKDEIKSKYAVKEIGIFGSYVKGEQKETSDVDILVDFEKPVSLLHIVSLENYLSDIVGIKVDILPKKNIRAELKEFILEETVPV